MQYHHIVITTVKLKLKKRSDQNAEEVWYLQTEIFREKVQFVLEHKNRLSALTDLDTVENDIEESRNNMKIAYHHTCQNAPQGIAFQQHLGSNWVSQDEQGERIKYQIRQSQRTARKGVQSEDGEVNRSARM